MLILGLDVATTTGFAWYDTEAHLSAIRTGLIKAEGDNAEQKAASLAVQLRSLFYETRIVGGEAKRILVKPDFVAIEQPMRNVKTFTKEVETLHGVEDVETINPNALQLSALVGAAIAIVAAYKIEWVTIPSATWRKSYFGSGFQPERKPVNDKFGRQKVDKKGRLVWKLEWKKAAIERCRALRIDVRNADAAEAVGIAFAGAGCQSAKMIDRARAA
jgi:hypothetical protein